MSPRSAPIFVQGILYRSGTNYLARLLERHPDCVLSGVSEDWLLPESDRLLGYARDVAAHWRRVPEWELGDEAEAALLRQLGDALVSFLAQRNEEGGGRRLVTKTPDVRALENLHRLVPDAHLLILVRDGRSVAESAVRSFGHSPARVARQWARAAGEVLDFVRRHGERSARHRLVRYEDLVQEPEKQIEEIFRFLGLDPERYDFSGVRSMPIYGSSTARSPSGGWRWRVSPPSAELGGVERFRDWSRAQHERFNGIAGERLEQLGYPMQRFSDRRLRWLLARALWLAGDLPAGVVRGVLARLAPGR